MKVWDHAFAGGGIAACSLALRIVGDDLGSVLLVDRTRHDPRSFAFWTDGPTRVDDLLAHTWPNLRVVGDGQDVLVPLDGWRYAMVRGEDVRARAHREILAHGGQVVLGEVERIEDGPEHAHPALVVDGIRHSARWIYDSRRRAATPALWQSFRGWWVETDHDAFDPAIATLMDFRAPQDAGGVRFFHVLPTSARRALVTGVNFAPERRAVDLAGYLTSLGLRDWRITGEEQGALAMDARWLPRQRGPRTLAIGVSGGLLKPSTGYAFTRMQDDAERIAASLRTDGHPFPRTGRRRTWRLLDAVLLRVVARRGSASERVFVALFARNPIGRVLRFLDERASLRDVLSLGVTLPAWRWFLAALLGK